MKSCRMRYPGNVILIGDVRNAYKIIFRKLKGRSHLEYLGANGKIVLKFT
jgi:hypothetical protein